MKIIDLAIHKVDIELNSFDEIKYSKVESDFSNYINGIITTILSGQKSRRFKFISETAEMFTLITRCLSKELFDKSARRSSERLLAEEMNLEHQLSQNALIN